MRDVVRLDQTAGHASWFHGASCDVVVACLEDAGAKGICLV
jgi:hypothetical protein